MNTDKIMQMATEWIKKVFTFDFVGGLLSALGIVLLVIVGFKLVQLVTVRILRQRLSDDRLQLVRKLFRYTAWTVATMTLLSSLGIDLRAILGAAGIAGIAVGFAAQTSISNVISGLFLISEKHFGVGDAVQIGDVSGMVQSVDFLSVKVRTWDNRFVRIPNETIIKSNVVNVTRFPIRRFDLRLSVAYDSDLEEVRRILFEYVKSNMAVLRDPAPLFVVEKFGDSGIEILLAVWFEKSRFADVRDSLAIGVKKTLDEAGIVIPFPQMDVHFDQVPVMSASGERLSVHTSSVEKAPKESE